MFKSMMFDQSRKKVDVWAKWKKKKKKIDNSE